MENRRQQNRKYLTYFSSVVEPESGQLLGYLVDLTTGGALMVGTIPLQLHEIFKLHVELPEDFAPQRYLEINAKVVWRQQDEDPEFYRTGLQLIDMKGAELLQLERLINMHGA